MSTPAMKIWYTNDLCKVKKTILDLRIPCVYVEFEMVCTSRSLAVSSFTQKMELENVLSMKVKPGDMFRASSQWFNTSCSGRVDVFFSKKVSKEEYEKALQKS